MGWNRDIHDRIRDICDAVATETAATGEVRVDGTVERLMQGHDPDALRECVRVGLAEIITSESRLDAARRRQERDKAA